MTEPLNEGPVEIKSATSEQTEASVRVFGSADADQRSVKEIDIKVEVDIKLEIDGDPNVERLMKMSFCEYLKSHLCDSIFLSCLSLGLWMGVEYYLYKRRVSDYLQIRKAERNDLIKALKRHDYDAHFDEKNELVIAKVAKR